MRVHLACDHAALDLVRHLATHLASAGHDVVDHAPARLDPDDDYPVYCLRAAEAVAGDPGSLGVVAGGSGNGEQMAANKVIGVRAALAWNEETATLARRHNDANVVSVGARMHTLTGATAIVDAFLAERFSGEARHQRRIDQVGAYERNRVLPPQPGA